MVAVRTGNVARVEFIVVPPTARDDSVNVAFEARIDVPPMVKLFVNRTFPFETVRILFVVLVAELMVNPVAFID